MSPISFLSFGIGHYLTLYKYHESSRKILSQEMPIFNMKSHIYYLEVVSYVNFSENRSKVTVKSFSTNRKMLIYMGNVLSLEIIMSNIEALAITVQKQLTRLKFSKNRSNSKVVKETGQNMLIPMQRSCHKKYSCEKYQGSCTHC